MKPPIVNLSVEREIEEDLSVWLCIDIILWSFLSEEFLLLLFILKKKNPKISVLRVKKLSLSIYNADLQS